MTQYQILVETLFRYKELRLRGLPEVTGPEDLATSAVAIFRQLTDGAIPADLELDRIHRTLGPRQSDPNCPQDVICRVHCFTQKEIIARKAWEVGNMDFDGASIKIMPDLSRAMLHRRGLLRPALDIARRQGATYRWGFPLSVTFKRGKKSFTLRTPGDLLAFFIFMDAEPTQIPDWL